MKKLIKIEELQNCPCFNLRLMARELTNEYNKLMQFNGIQSTQIPILAIMHIYGQIETSRLAKLLNLEISTLRRNLSILEKKEVIKIIKKNNKGNLFTLTDKGFYELKKILPIWRKAGNESRIKLKKRYLTIINNIFK